MNHPVYVADCRLQNYIYKISYQLAEKKSLFNRKKNWLMMLREIIAVYLENNAKK